MTAVVQTQQTPTRQRVLDFITTYIKAEGYGPSIRDIAAGVGLSSVSSAEWHIGQLEAAGRIRRTRRIPRSIRIVEVTA